VGHSKGEKCGIVIKADGIILNHAGVEEVADLFGHQENHLTLD
jgi:hypothetical protein